jgi:V/A-type H+-transporting ATPase subunit K
MALDLLSTIAPLANQTGPLANQTAENVTRIVESQSGPALPEGSLEYFGAGLAVGLAALGSGYAERGIGSAAVGAMAEDEDLFVRGLILTVLPETLVIFALLVVFLA